MIILIFNFSKKKAFRRTKRIISEVLFPVTNRVNIGDIPKRVIIKIIANLKSAVTKGVMIEIYVESKNIGFRGFKCYQIGTRRDCVEEFVISKSLIDKELIFNRLISKSDP